MKKQFFFICFLLIAAANCLLANEFNRDSVLVLLEDTTLDKSERARAVIDKAPSVKEPEERRYIYEDILLPYVKEEIKDPVLNPTYRIAVHLALIRVYASLQDNDSRVRNMEAAVKLAEESEKQIDTTVRDEKTDLYNGTRANAYRINGQMHSQIGEPSIGHEYLYKAIRIYESLEKYERVANCLYMIAIDFHQISDAAGLGKIIEQMKAALAKDNDNNSIRHNLYAVEAAYYETRLKQDSIVNYSLVDSLLNTSRKTIGIIENHRNEIASNMVPAWEYYSVATTLNEYYPGETDSIFYYLDKASNAKLDWDPVSSKEVDISVNKLAAMVHYREKQYTKAESEMLAVLSMLDEMGNRNSLKPDYIEAYHFLAELYDSKNNDKEALKYMKLLRGAEMEMYDQEKINAINDVSAKYEVEKKEARITRLEEKELTTRRILLLIVALAVILLIALFAIVWIFRLRKKNLEQAVYESALLAELKQNELNAYREKSEDAKQQVGNNHTRAMADKISDWVTRSLIDKEKKDIYIDKLAQLDTKALEQGYLSTQEKITAMDMKYIICFAIDMNVKDISLIFNVEPASVRTVRYRIRKKFGEKNPFNFLIS